MLYKNKPILALAPMADFTDSPFCRVCREVSGKDFLIYREMVSAEAVVRDNEKTLNMASFQNSEKPIILQIFGLFKNYDMRNNKLLSLWIVYQSQNIIKSYSNLL